MAYSTSALYHKTGGGGRVSNLLVAALMVGFLMLGPSAITYFPRPLAGSLLMHLGEWRVGRRQVILVLGPPRRCTVCILESEGAPG